MDDITSALALRTDALSVGDPHKPVSTTSAWGDPVWRLDGGSSSTPAGSTAVYWPVEVDEELLESFRRLFWSVYVAPQDQRPPSELTLASYHAGMKLLARWMDEEAYTFELVDRDFGVHLLEHLAEIVAAWEDDEVEEDSFDVDPDDDEDDHDPTVASPFNTVLGMLRIVSLIHSQRGVLRRMGVGVSDEDPLQGRTPWACAHGIAARADTDRHALPSEVALPLMAATDRLVAGGALEDVAQLMEECVRVLAGKERARSTVRSRALAGVLDGFRFRTLPGETQPWHAVTRDDDERSRRSADVVHDLVSFCQTVAVLVLLQLTGMRPAEILGLKGGVDEETGLPACIETVSGPSGALRLFYVRSMVKKGRTVPEEARWLIGAGPIGRDALPTTVLAIRALERIGRPWRSRSSDDAVRSALVVGLPGNASILRLDDGIAAKTSVLQKQLKAAYGRLMDFSALPDRTKDGMSLVRYKASASDGSGLGPRIATSQWRKTFATMLTLIDGRLSPSISRQFQHLHAGTLDAAYLPSDNRLLEMIGGGRTRTVMGILGDRIDGIPAEIGRAGRILERSTPRIRRIVEDARGEHGAITGLVDLHAPAAWRGEHADCAFFIAPHRAACHEAAGTSHFLNEAPDFALRRPETCLGCANARIVPAHARYWLMRYLEANRARRTLTSPAASVAMQERARVAVAVFVALRRRMPEGRYREKA